MTDIPPIPIGTILPLGLDAETPDGWYDLNGQRLSCEVVPVLWANLGVTDWTKRIFEEIGGTWDDQGITLPNIDSPTATVLLIGERVEGFIDMNIKLIIKALTV